jgi:hypothetical protein
MAHAIDELECIWRGRMVWKHMLAQETVAVGPYYQVERSGSADDIRDAIRAKWERAGEPLDVAAGISPHDPQLAKYIEVELLFDGSAL